MENRGWWIRKERRWNSREGEKKIKKVHEKKVRRGISEQNG